MKKLIFIICFVSFMQAQTWDGLIRSNTINDITQESDFLWLATDGGLVKYNKVNGSYNVYHRGNSDISYNYITSVLIDKSGNKWIGTWDGLNKFNGSEWIVYTKTNSGLPVNRINDIAMQSNGNLWFATQSGVVKYDGTNWTTYNLQDNSGNNLWNIKTIHLDKNDVVWCGTSSDYYQVGGLFKYENSTWTSYTIQNSGIQDYIINDIVSDKSGNIWLASESKGLIKFNKTSWVNYDNTNSNICDIRLTHLHIDNNNLIWISSDKYISGGGVASFNGSVFTNYVSPSFPSESSSIIFADLQNNIYASANNKGLALFKNASWQIQNISFSGIPSNAVTAIYCDLSDNVWIGTEDKGVAKYKNGVWNYFNTDNGLPNSSVLCIHQDKKGVIWIGTRDGAAKIQNNTITKITGANTNELVTGWINDINTDSKDNVYFASDNGVIKYDGAAYTAINRSNMNDYPNTPVTSVKSITFDKTDNIWLGLNGYGVIKYDWNSCTGYSINNSGLNYVEISSIIMQDDTLWIGTGQGPDGTRGTLYKFDGTNWSNFRPSNSQIPFAYINKIRKLNDNSLLICGIQYGQSFGGGFTIKKGNLWTNYSMTNSRLAYSYTKDVAYDSKGNLFIATFGYGVSVFNKNGIVDINDQEYLPENIVLKQNYPNPFNPSTVIEYSLPQAGFVKLKVFDSLGREITTLVNEYKAAGNYSSFFTLRSSLATGVYFYSLSVDNKTLSKKMMFIK